MNHVPVNELISKRRSTRAFSDRTITDDILLRLFEAARWAPSSYNEQPWRFILARRSDTQAFAAMLDCLNESNRSWAQHGNVLIMPVAKLFTTHNHYHNRHAFHDVGLAVANLSVEATAHDIFLHQLGGFYLDKARETFAIPDEYEPVSIIVVGYAGDFSVLPDNLRQREEKPRQRLPLEQLVFTGKFGETDRLSQQLHAIIP
jgi:nitroreductase